MISNVPVLKAVELYSEDFSEHLSNLNSYYSKSGWGWGYGQLVSVLIGYLKTKNEKFALSSVRSKFKDKDKEKLSHYLDRTKEFISIFSSVDVVDCSVFRHEPIVCYQTHVKFPEFIKYKSNGKAYIVLSQFNKNTLLKSDDIDLLFSLVKYHVLDETETEFLNFQLLRFEGGVGKISDFSDVQLLSKDYVRQALIDIGLAYAQTERAVRAPRPSKKPSEVVVYPDLFGDAPV